MFSFLSAGIVSAQLSIDNQVKSIEKDIKKNFTLGMFSSTPIDLDNDGDIDYVFTYLVGEPQCVEVYMNINGMLKQVIKELVGGISYVICPNALVGAECERNTLQLNLNHCCGESPFTSIRNFFFEKDKAVLRDNYVVYTEDTPLFYLNRAYQSDYLEESYNVKLNDQYNLRFYPSADKYIPASKSDDGFIIGTCFENTNIIAQLKKGAIVRVIDKTRDEFTADGKIWLYVEVAKEDLAGDCNPIDFDFEDQKLRGWIRPTMILPHLSK